MQPSITIGLDIAMYISQVHAADVNGAIAIRRKLRQSELLSFFGGLSVNRRSSLTPPPPHLSG